MRLVIEYLIIFEKTGSFCDNIETFNKLLEVNSNISINEDTIVYKEMLELEYGIKSGEIEGLDQRFFHIIFTFDEKKDKIDDCLEFLKDIRTTLYKAKGQSEILWDDISYYYSKQAYPLVYEIENLMRKLITNFMLTNVGKDWTAKALPKEVRDAIDKSKRKTGSNILYQIDFKHLADLLFKPYQTESINDLYDKLNDATKLENLDLDELKSFLPKSNWERFFSDIVECDDTYLNKKWNKLYNLRCKVAHNAIVTKNDYMEIARLTDEVRDKLQKAIDNLDKIDVHQEDIDTIAESIDEKFLKLLRLSRDTRLTYNDSEKPDVETMVEWFFENYEDPANGVPYESREGGYLYIFGGPYDAHEELWEQFPHADPNDIDKAVDKIIPYGGEWIKIGQY